MRNKVRNKVGSIEISSYDYSVNAIGQRTSVATSRTAFSGAAGWNWAYDAYGQVTLAEHGTNSSFHRSYAYDDIGNRLKTAESLTLPTSPPLSPPSGPALVYIYKWKTLEFVRYGESSARQLSN